MFPELSNPGGKIIPRVVGTVITAEYLRRWSANPVPLPCPIVELRVDGFPDFADWLEAAQSMEQRGIPVFATVRLAAEGGKWSRPDRDRWPLLESAAAALSGVDIELESELAERVGRKCAELGKVCVISHHDFDRTPPFEEMLEIMRRAEKLGGIPKIATRANTPEDLAHLRKLLHQNWNGPVCVIGMGPYGKETRLSFPLEGSCFTYGYLDEPGAPGQFSAEELTRYLEERRKTTP